MPNRLDAAPGGHSRDDRSRPHPSRSMTEAVGGRDRTPALPSVVVDLQGPRAGRHTDHDCPGRPTTRCRPDRGAGRHARRGASRRAACHCRPGGRLPRAGRALRRPASRAAGPTSRPTRWPTSRDSSAPGGHPRATSKRTSSPTSRIGSIPGYLAYFPVERLGHRDRGRARHQRPQRQRVPVANVAGRDRARGHHRGLAARGPRSAGRVRWRLQRHRLDEQPGRPGSSSAARHRPGLAGRPTRVATASHLHVDRRPLLHRASGHDPRHRPAGRPCHRRG